MIKKVVHIAEYLLKFKIMRPLILIPMCVMLVIWLPIWYIFDLDD